DNSVSFSGASSPRIKARIVLARDEFQTLASEEPEDGRGLAPGGGPAPLEGVRGVGHVCGLLGLGVDDVPTRCPTEPRGGGSSCRAGRPLLGEESLQGFPSDG